MLEEKLKALDTYIRKLERAAVAFSGGTDSALLAYAAKNALGNNAFAFTIWSPLLSHKDKEDILNFTALRGITLVKIPFDETESADFCENTKEKCYFCKSARVKALEAQAEELSIPWVLDGSNTDDLGDFRPGMKALKESACVKSPLLDCGFSKSEIREASRLFGLPTAEKPAAACLASRIPAGVPVKKTLLGTIENGETFLRKYIPQNLQLRMRFDGETASIETDLKCIPLLTENFDEISKKLKEMGAKNTVICQQGYKMGGASLTESDMTSE